jgi:hypothetical protein
VKPRARRPILRGKLSQQAGPERSPDHGRDLICVRSPGCSPRPTSPIVPFSVGRLPQLPIVLDLVAIVTTDGDDRRVCMHIPAGGDARRCP